MAYSFGTPSSSTQSSTLGAAPKPTPFGALGATPASTAPFLTSGTDATAAVPTKGFGHTSFGAPPTFGSTEPILGSTGSNTLGGTNTFTPFGGSSSFGNTIGSAPQFEQIKFRIRYQSEQTKLQTQALQRAEDELAELRTRRAAASARLVQLAARLHACRPTLLQVVRREEEAAWARVYELTTQLAAPPLYSHDMRPEITALSSPHTKPDVGSHPSVENFRNVLGVEKNVYFFNHDYKEETQGNNNIANPKEADMIFGLANYLMQQGYTADDITILTAYSGQMIHMRKELQKYRRLSNVKITVVDDYQGEESKILLLSLVRNNEENTIGFLGTENRVCVALSRAKEGLYIFGNINMLKTAKSGLWTKIATTLENNDCLGTTLILKCQNHPDQKTEISTSEQFYYKIAHEGGCFEKCNYTYLCGHKCQQVCHISDREHIKTKCTKKCKRVLCKLGHVCPLKCREECEPCRVLVMKTLPCGHEIYTFCYRDPEDPRNKCLTKVDVTLPDCGHKVQKVCYRDINEVACWNACDYRLECRRDCHATDDPDHEKVVARREVVAREGAALSPEEEAAWARVNELTTQLAAPPLYGDDMRPEIAALSSPHTKPDVENHPSVEAFRNVLGLEKNVYFFNHDYKEETQHDNNSIVNHKEADMILALAKYLMLQGYTADDIIILATYSGQMLYMRKERQCYPTLSHVKITVVDDYQGEESKILLLSLVRNNEENTIGLLGTDNRVCVALSRAKEGLYIFGNINMLKTAKSGLWTKIATTLENNDCLGTTLILKCQHHPDQKTEISTQEDFLYKIPARRRCFETCNYQLNCGHNCQRRCHRYDREHIDTKCILKCERVLCELGHVCQLKCHEECEPCRVLVMKTLPCGHEMETFCYRDPDDPRNKCLTKVVVTLPDCGHKAQKICYRDIKQVKCLKRCVYRLECGHVCGRDCHATDDPNHEKIKCYKPCARAKAGCVADLMGDRGEHQCRRLCFEKCNDCHGQVEKVIPECLHTIKLECKQIPSHELCYEKCKRLLSCGHPCMDRCGAACGRTKCTKPSFAEVLSPCGHSVRLPCNVLALFLKGEVKSEQLPQYCSEPCGATLACKHLCAGSCAGCAQGRLHQPCTQQCNQDNICGHQCQEPCNQICPPCKMPCEVKCIHSLCNKLCGEPCTPCQEACSRVCPHGACSRRCGEPCSRAPCDERCARRRPCGHACRGLCGEPCPDICQLCRPDHFPTDFLGDQYELTDRFIVLQDCGHVLEVDSMDSLMMGDQENIQIRKCPFCRKAIINTNRYKDAVNKMFEDDINPIKLRVYGTRTEIDIKLTELHRNVDRFTEEYGMYLEDYPKKVISIFTSLLKAQKKVSLLQVEMECMYLNIFEMIIECWKTYRTQTPPVTTLKDELKKHIKILLEVLKIKPESRIPIKISEQQQNDVGNEIKRLNVIVQLSKLLHLALSIKDEQVTRQVDTTKAVVFSLSVFNEDRALESLKQLQKVIKIRAPVTKYERELIVKAVGLKAGHWYKCPNGHYYCIGECGGAMALGRCPEAGCGAAIGGAQHTLTAGNSHAPEMDGSRFAAWSEQANNMANFALDD